jgi:hypothetical protein
MCGAIAVEFRNDYPSASIKAPFFDFDKPSIKRRASPRPAGASGFI